MYALITRYLKDKKTSIAAYSIAEILFVTMYTSLFPALQKQAEELQKLLATYPRELYSVFQIQDLNFSTLEKFLGLEQYSFMWPILAIILATSLAGGALAHEVSKGTMANLLAKPVSRMQLYFARYIACIKAFAMFVVISIFCVIPIAAIFRVDFVARAYAVLAVLCFLFGSTILSIAYMFSAIFSEKSKVYMVTGGLVFLMYVLNVVASLRDNIKNLRYASLFYYFDFNTALGSHYIRWLAVFVFLGISVACTALGAFIFKKRDISV